MTDDTNISDGHLGKLTEKCGLDVDTDWHRLKHIILHVSYHYFEKILTAWDIIGTSDFSGQFVRWTSHFQILLWTLTFLYNGNSCTGKMTSFFYQIAPAGHMVQWYWHWYSGLSLQQKRWCYLNYLCKTPVKLDHEVMIFWVPFVSSKFNVCSCIVIGVLNKYTISCENGTYHNRTLWMWMTQLLFKAWT